MNDLKSEYNQCLYHTSVAMGRSLARLADEQFKPLDITPTMGFVLMTAKTAPGVIIRDLALVHQLDMSTISRTIDKMVAKDLVTRQGQGREMRIFTTQKGMRKEAEARSAWDKLKLAYGSILSEGRSRQLADQVREADSLLRERMVIKRRKT